MHRRLFSTLAALTLMLAPGIAHSGRAQAISPASNAALPTTFFPFVVPWDDATGGTATDMSFLSPHTAGDDGYVVARDGHFFATKTKRRVRFLGTNFTFANDFPAHADAEKVAAHLRKLGINIVRIHHHDADYGKLWDRKYPDHRHIDAEARDRLDYLIYQLKRNGVYVDLNLHVSREFTQADGFPASIDQIKDYDKRVDYFEPRMIALQKEFARDYLTHVNPYTHQSYCEDPCVALIEINNENSLVGDAGSRLAGSLAGLPTPFRGELVAQWNDWLANKYHTDAALSAAWSAGAMPLGANLLAGPTAKWTIEHQGEALASLMPAPPSADGAPGATIDVAKIDATDWHVQAHFTGLTLKEGDTYTVTFQARIPDGVAERDLHVGTALDQADWHNTGLNTSVKVEPTWKTYRAYFAARNTVPGHCRLTFGLGNQAGVVEIRDVHLQPGVPAPTSAGDETSLAKRNIDLPESATTPQRADWLHFLADTERRYADGMRDFVKTDLHAHGNICCSQIMWGESAGMYREAHMDFADGHAYWEHPSFPHKAWDMSDWRIGNRPMVPDLSTGGGTLANLAQYRVADKPYTITEYNEPAPNDFQCETVPELAAYAAAQDWDAIFLFDWGDYGATAPNDRIQSFFSTGSNPAKTAFLPAAALIFRGEEIGILAPKRMIVEGNDALLEATPLGSLWQSHLDGWDSSIPFEYRLETIYEPKRPRGAPTLNGQGSGTVAREVVSSAKIETTARRFVVSGGTTSSAAGTAVGYLGGTSVVVGAAHFDIAAFGNNFCAVTVTPNPHAAGSTLITLVGRVENVGMGWNAARDSVGAQWGRGPTQAEFIPATVTLLGSPRTRVWALDATGKRTREIPAKREGGKVTFQTDAKAQTVWYEAGII